MHKSASLALFAGALLATMGCGDGSGGSTNPPEPMWASAPYTQYVDPFVGSGGRGFGYGSAVVGAMAPFGMVRLSPDTTGPNPAPFHHFSGYHPDDPIIVGFPHLHFHGTGAQGYGNLLMMPVPGFTNDKIKASKYRSRFDKATETASPGYYAARLANGDILAELTSSGRSGMHRYTFGQGSKGAGVVVDAAYVLGDRRARDIQLELDASARRLTGHHRSDGGLSGGFDLYWAIEFDRPLASYGMWRGSAVLPDTTTVDSPSEDAGAYLEFAVADGEQVTFRVGVSFVDVAGAIGNLRQEAPSFDFHAMRTATVQRWETLLGRVKVEESDPVQLKMLYSAVYHTLVTPTVMSDADGRYRGFDGAVHQADGFEYYSDLSLWDTFRTLHPWLTLVYPEPQRDIIISLLKMYEQDGFLPIWPVAGSDSGTMIGASAELVIADSFVKGLRDYDVELAYEAVTRSAREPRPQGSSSPGRRHIQDYLSLGYVAYESDESSTSMTLEYAASDGAVAQFARALGRDADAAEFEGRAGSYRNHWDPETKFFRARYRDGRFKTPFDSEEWGRDYREATAWQYLWYVPHDPEGLMNLFGGREGFVTALSDFFDISKREHDGLDELTRLLYRTYYWAGNEPDIHTPYLFIDAGRPDLAGRWSRWALDTSFGPGPDGLPGNDDCGTMSAWFAFAALGIYPVPGYDKYYVAAPRYTAAELQTISGKLRILAPGAGPMAVVPTKAELDGKRLPEFLFRHTDLEEESTLEVEVEAATE